MKIVFEPVIKYTDICFYCHGHIHYGKPICTCGNRINTGVNMSELTNQEVAQIVESEGLGYAVGEYLNSDSIQDAELRELWENAQVSLNELDVFLAPHYEEV